MKAFHCGAQLGGERKDKREIEIERDGARERETWVCGWKDRERDKGECGLMCFLRIQMFSSLIIHFERHDREKESVQLFQTNLE